MKTRSKLLPTPLLSVLLLVVWLLLQNSAAPGQILLGTVLAIAIPAMTNRYWNRQPDIHRPWLMVRYALRVLGDIVTANLNVAKIILSPNNALRPGFVEVPLDIRGDFPITVLASTVSLTPGTVSADVSEDRKRLLVHALHVEDEAALIAEIKQRYEAPLREIFQC